MNYDTELDTDVISTKVVLGMDERVIDIRISPQALHRPVVGWLVTRYGYNWDLTWTRKHGYVLELYSPERVAEFVLTWM